MEQEETTVDPHYLKGFNNGYLLARHEPKLAAQLAASPNEQNPYFNGLVSGKEQYDKEVREWSKSFAKGTPARDERGLQKDDRDIQKER